MTDIAFGRLLGRLGITVIALLSAGAAFTAAGAARSSVGIVPPAHPASNCPVRVGADPLSAIDACRAREGVGPMHLPSNWARLTAVEQTFVAIDLERVNRGLKPVAGITVALDDLAQQGASAGEDPSFPASVPGLRSAGAIWWEATSPLAAVYYWMYEDGPGGGNISCPASGGPDCWAHRGVILMRQSNLIGGGGHAGSNTTFEILGVSPSSEKGASFVFDWSTELRYFAAVPRSEAGRS